jgi:hypothetical protein
MKCSAVLFSVALVAVLVTGCSGGSGDKPSSLPTLTGPAPTASPAAVPEAAKAKTALGADAFVRFFFSQLNVAFAIGDGSPIEALSNDECVLCQSYIAAVATEKVAGKHVTSDTFLVSEVAARPIEELGTLVEVYGQLPSRREFDAAGRLIATIPAGGRFHFQVAVKNTSTGWTVSGVRRAAQ